MLSKNKRPERKGKIQLIDASSFSKKLRKALGDKKNEISPEERTAITKLYADFADKVAKAQDARIVVKGNVVVMVIAGVNGPDYSAIDTAIDGALA